MKDLSAVTDPKSVSTKEYVDSLIAASVTFYYVNDGGGSYSAFADSFVTADANGGPLTIALPNAPADGSICHFSRPDNTANAVTLSSTGTDRFSDGTSSWSLRARQAVTFVYAVESGALYGAPGLWHPVGHGMTALNGMGSPTASPTATTLMARDANGRAAVATPSGLLDIANKLYVDTATAVVNPITRILFR